MNSGLCSCIISVIVGDALTLSTTYCTRVGLICRPTYREILLPQPTLLLFLLFPLRHCNHLSVPRHSSPGQRSTTKTNTPRRNTERQCRFSAAAVAATSAEWPLRTSSCTSSVGRPLGLGLGRRRGELAATVCLSQADVAGRTAALAAVPQG